MTQSMTTGMPHDAILAAPPVLVFSPNTAHLPATGAQDAAHGAAGHRPPPRVRPVRRGVSG